MICKVVIIYREICDLLAVLSLPVPINYLNAIETDNEEQW